MFKEYNNITYDQQINLIEWDSDFYQSEITSIPNDYIMSMQLISSIHSFVPEGSIVIRDHGNKLFNDVYAEGTYNISIYIKGASNDRKDQFSQPDVDIPEFSAGFIVSGITLLEKDNNFNTYKLHLIHKDWYKFNNYFNFAVKDEDVITAIKSIFKSNKMELVNEEGDSPASKISFIAPTSYNCNKTIRNLLSLASNSDYGPYLVSKKIYDDIYTISNLKKVWAGSESSAINTNNVFRLVGNEDMSTGRGSDYFTVSDLVESSLGDIGIRTEARKTLIERKFNHKTRNWSDEIKSFDGYINKSIPASIITENTRPILKANQYIDTEKTIINDTKDLPQGTADKFYDAVTDLIFKGDIITFKTQGWLTRNSNELGVIITPPTEKLSDRYSGTWYLTGVVHNFNGDMYTNHITATRTYKIVKTEEE